MPRSFGSLVHFITLSLLFTSLSAADEPAASNPCAQVTESDCPEQSESFESLLILKTDLGQKTLKLTEKQKQSLANLESEYQKLIEKLALDLNSKREKSEVCVSSEKLRPLVLDIGESQIWPRIEEALTADQRHRLNQIYLQTMHLSAFRVKPYSEKLQLAADQVAKIKIEAERFNKAAEYPELFFRAGPNALSDAEHQKLEQKYQEDYWAAASKATENSIAVLNPQQRKTLEELWGERVELRKLQQQLEDAGVHVDIHVPITTEKISESISVTIGSGGNTFIGCGRSVSQ